MNDTKGLKKELPPTTGDFVVDVLGDITNKRYVGEFTCKIMNKKDQAMAAKHRANLNGSMAEFLDVLTLKLHHQISYLRFALIGPFPKFWQNSDLGYDLYDGNVIEEVYNKVLEFEDEWMIKVWGKKKVNELKDESDSAE